MEQGVVDGLLSAVDNPGFLWYLQNQHLLLLYYLLTRSGGCKDKLCGLFLRAGGCHGAWEPEAFTLRRPGNGPREAKQSQTRGRQQGQRNKEQKSGSMLQRAMVSSSAKRGR